MIQMDEDALICDLAETYRIYDYKSLPVDMVATFSVGLREDSRIKRKMNDIKQSLNSILLAAICDGISTLVWMNSTDGQVGTNRPKSILSILMGSTEKENDVMAFETPEEFERAWNS